MSAPTPLSLIAQKSIRSMVTQGFTFYADDIFATYGQAKLCLDTLAKIGYAVCNKDSYGRTYFTATDAGRDYHYFGILIEGEPA